MPYRTSVTPANIVVRAMQVTYSTLIDGCVREGAVDTGRQLLTEMVARGVKPNAVTYNTLLRAYAMDDKVEMKV